MREPRGKMSLIFLLKPLDFFSLLHGEFARDPFYIQGTML